MSWNRRVSTSSKTNSRKNEPSWTARPKNSRSELSLVDSDLAKIDAAIAALDGKEVPLAAKPAKPGKKKAKQGPAVGKADVIKFLRTILEKEGVVEEPTLKTLVEEQVTQAGFTRMGFALRFKEALAESEFVDSPGGVRLAELAAAK